MYNMSEDIQYAGSDTRPPMLDRIDFESWQQRIRLYCLGMDNGENIMKSITEGPFKMGTLRETLPVTGIRAPQLGPERDRIFADLSVDEKEMYKADIRGQNRGGNMNPGQAKPIKCYNCNGIRHIARECPQPKRPQDSNYFKEKMLLMQAQENGAVLDEEKLLFLAGEQVTNFDEDVDDPTEQDLALNTMFTVNLSSKDLIYDEAGLSYDSNTPSEVQDHDNFADNVDEYHKVHEMQNDVQHNYVVNSDAEYTSNGNIIPYDQYMEDNKENVVQSNVSSVQNDALMSIINEMHKHGVQSRTNHAPAVVHDSEDTLEIAEITRNRMFKKINSPLYLTPEHIFWSKDELEIKSTEPSVPKPLSTANVYPPNTPVKLVPKVLPTKSQVSQLRVEWDHHEVKVNEKRKIENFTLVLRMAPIKEISTNRESEGDDERLSRHIKKVSQLRVEGDHHKEKVNEKRKINNFTPKLKITPIKEISTNREREGDDES
ncbi:retrovirus-related pol polyprotein from transposon TNT 1-94 [Tanacetum coccineum]